MSMSAEGVRLRVGIVSTKGNVREHNEDNFYVPGMDVLRNGPPTGPTNGGADYEGSAGNGGSKPQDRTPTGPEGLFIVADGMGGQLAGERASQLAVELIPAEFAKRLPGLTDEKAVQKAIREAVARANEEILAQSHLQAEFANMGTTVVLAYFRNGRAFVAGIGDSRAYHLHSGKFEQLTRDHSLANALGEAGTIRPEEVESHRFKHVLYLYLGSKDAADGPEEVKVVDYRPGDQFLLASDGLTGVVKDEMIAEVLRGQDDPQRAAERLINRALENRSKDNITCLVIRVV
jgi:protein phosphatase